MLEKIRLLKDWGKRKAGTTIEVDSARAQALREGGFVDEGKTKKGRKKADELHH